MSAPPTPPVRWAIVSTGRISADFVNALKLNGSQIVAVCSRTQESADAFGNLHNIPNRFGSIEAMLANAKNDFDIVYVGTPHSNHESDTVKCLDRGVGVLCEKPLAVNAHQVSFMLAAAAKNRVFLAEGLWTRFFPISRQVRQLIHVDKAIGEVRAVHGTFGFFDSGKAPRLVELADAGGALLDIGVYLLFGASLGIGGFHNHDYSRLRASALFGPTGCDTQTSIQLEYPDGRAVSLVCSIQSPLPNELVYVGTRGSIVLRKPFHAPTTMTTYINDATTRGVVHEQTNTLPLEGASPDDATLFNFGNSRGFIYEIRAVEKLVAEGALECDEVPLAESLAVAKIMDSVREQIGLKYPFEK
jgi:predicted dehydrogenase